MAPLKAVRPSKDLEVKLQREVGTALSGVMRRIMEDVRPYLTEDDEVENTSENPLEWELARLNIEDELPFHIPRD